MSPHTRRNATAQAGFPKGRAGWLIGAIMLAIVITGIVVVRGAWGPPMSRFGLVVRTLALLMIAVLPVAAMVWAWKRLPRWGRRVAPMPIGVLSLMLALLAFAQARIYAERVWMGRDPAAMAAAAFSRGDRRFLAVEDSLNSLVVPRVNNRCIINRYETHTIDGTGGMTVNGRHARYRRRAVERAQAYNQVLLERLRVPAALAGQTNDGSNCPD